MEKQKTNDEPDFKAQLTALINKFSLENYSNTPDFILAEYMKEVLDSFNKAISLREKWYGKETKEILNQ